MPRPSSPLGAKASTRCPCFPRPPPATTATRPTRSAIARGPRPAGTVPAETEQGKGRRPSQKMIPATTTKGPRCAERPAYPCQMRVLPTDGRDQEKGRTRDLPMPAHARRTTMDRSTAPSPPTGTSHHLTMSKQHPPRRPRTAGGRQAGSPSGRRASTPCRRCPRGLVGLGRFERPTSRLSGVRSNQLSYRPKIDGAEIGTTRAARISLPAERLLARDVQTAAGHDPRRPVKIVAEPLLPGRARGGGVPVKSSSLARRPSCADAELHGVP